MKLCKDCEHFVQEHENVDIGVGIVHLTKPAKCGAHVDPIYGNPKPVEEARNIHCGIDNPSSFKEKVIP